MGVDLNKSAEAQTAKATEKVKPTYEQLEQFVGQVMNENNQLKSELKRINDISFFKRMDYLFEAVKNAAYFETEFIDKCVSEIQSILYPEQKDTEEEQKPEEE